MTDRIRLSRTFLYPIKSLRGVEVDTLTIEGGRAVGDRLWILVDERGRFMHQRDYPQMATIDVRVDGESVELTDKAGGVLRLSTRPPSRSRSVTHICMWRRAASVVDVGRDADDWFTRALGVNCRVHRFADYETGLDVPASEVDASLQDATPFHLTSEDSLQDLNRRLELPIPMNRFRPNISVSGAPPYAEDAWKEFRIGAHTFRWVRPCTRCVMTTTDHLSGERHGTEPLRTLARYRRLGGEVVFGHYVTTDSRSGRLTVGDAVEVRQ